MSNAAVYIWIFTAGNMDTTANGGIGIVLGDGTNRRSYYVGGSDQSRFQVGTWGCYMVHGANPPTQYNQEAGSSAPNFSAITQVGVRFKTLSKSLGGADNCFIDNMHWGTGITVKGGGVGTEGTFSEVATADEAKTGAYGIIRTVQTGVYEVQGKITIGDTGTGSSYFKDTDAVIVFADNGAGDSFYEFSLQGNSTGTNTFEVGVQVGTGDDSRGRNGITLLSAGPDVYVGLGDSNMDTIKIYGSQFKNLGTIELSGDTATEFYGNTIDNCYQVIANQTIIRNCNFNGYTIDSDAALLWNNSINIKNCNFIANTDSTNDPHAIEHPNSGTYTYDNLQFSGNDYDINFSASSGTLTINATNGSDPSTYEITGSGTSVTINNAVNVTVTVKNTSGTNIENARVLVEADTGGSLPAGDTVTITRSGDTATVSHSSHGLVTGDYVIIRGANQDEYNGDHQITVINTNSYKYTVSGTPATPATGNITSTFRIINKLTNSSGIATESLNYSSDQPIKGTARKASSTPYYKIANFVGTITSSGFSTIVQLVSDE